MKAFRFKYALKISTLLFGLCVAPNYTYAAQYDFDNGNAATDVVIPQVLPYIFQSVSPSGGDATLVLRVTTMVTNAWFDAIAPYHPTAIGVYSNLGRRPASESMTNYNMNVSIMYATYRVLNSLLPQHEQAWRDLMMSAGLDPDDNQQNKVTPIGIGNIAGKAIVAAREQDGMNQLGNEGGKIYNLQPYADYTGYSPVNTAYKLTDPSRWQPSITTTGGGLFKIQQFVTPQMAQTQPYSYPINRRFPAPTPDASNINNFYKYKQQADEVLHASANLTDKQKMITEFFDNKPNSLGVAAFMASQFNQMNLTEFVHYDFLVNAAAFDTAIAIWKEKRRYDAVRPFSAIAYLYGDKPVTAWGGPGKGTVNALPASQWRSYLNVADHPEYPSASASFCGAHSEASRLYAGSDLFGWQVLFARGSSKIEPGVTPAVDTSVTWNTWTEFEHDCGNSRVWGGVHFPAAVPAGREIGHQVAKITYEFVRKHISGNTD